MLELPCERAEGREFKVATRAAQERRVWARALWPSGFMGAGRVV